MDLGEIQEKADDLAISLLATDSKNMAMLYGMQIEGLKDLAIIIAASDRRHEWNASAGQQSRDTELRKRELVAMETAAAAAERASKPARCESAQEVFLNGTKTALQCTYPGGHGGWHKDGYGAEWLDAEPGPEVYTQHVRRTQTVDLPDPVKPVADRLHELVSYFHDQHHGNLQVARSKDQGTTDRAGYTQAGSAYADAKDKLEEILIEGGI